MSAAPSDPHAAARERRRRAWAALAGSAVLHLGAAALLLRNAHERSYEPAPAPPRAPIDVSLLESEEGADAEPRPEPSIAAPPHAERHRAGPSSTPPRAVRPAYGVASSTDGETREVAAAPAHAAETESSDFEHAPNLSFDALGDAAKRRVTSLPNPEEALEQLLVPGPETSTTPRTLSEARATAERRADAIENVGRGRAHPLHFDYLRDARRLIVAEAERLGDELSLDAGETLAGWARGYLDRVAEAGRSAPRDRPVPDELNGDRRPDVLGAFNEAEAQAAAGAERRAAHVCLGVAPAHPVVVTLRRSSGNAHLDRVALDAFQSAATGRPVAADVRPGLACYLVQLSAYRMPPLPSLSLGWKNGRPELIHPLARRHEVTVELESVDYGAAPAPSSLLRRPH